MSRIDDLPANYLKKHVNQLQTQLQEVKTAQFAGSQNVQLQRIVSGNASDFTATIAYNTVTIWEVTFTPNDQTFANSSFIWHIFWDAVAETGSGGVLDSAETLVPDNNIQVFRLYLMGTTPAMSLSIAFQVRFYALGGGTFSVAQIA